MLKSIIKTKVIKMVAWRTVYIWRYTEFQNEAVMRYFEH